MPPGSRWRLTLPLTLTLTLAANPNPNPAATGLKVEADLSDGEGKWMAAVAKAVGDKDVQVYTTHPGLGLGSRYTLLVSE